MSTEALAEETEDQAPSLADDLAAAWDDSDSTDEVAEETPADEKPEFETAQLDESTAVEDEPKELAEAGAPDSWTPAMREKWGDIPKDTQAYIRQREEEVSQGIQKYAHQAKRAQAMDQVLQPYQQYLQMTGGPSASIGTLLQTGALLQMGSPQQKAEMVSNIIKQYSVDIATLDNMLVGHVDPQQQEQTQLQQMVAQQMQPYQQMFQQMQNGQEQQVQQQNSAINNEVSTFAQDGANEFYNDVKMDMADILDMNANRGQQLSLKDAYDRACRMNPEISRIMDTRSASQLGANKRRASSSISGGPGGSGGGGSDTMRGAIEDAWANAGRV